MRNQEPCFGSSSRAQPKHGGGALSNEVRMAKTQPAANDGFTRWPGNQAFLY